MTFAGAIQISAVLIYLAYYYWHRAEKVQCTQHMGRFPGWALKGLGIPLGAWLFLNLGLFEHLPPLLAELGAGKFGGGPWFFSYLAHVDEGLTIITSYWAAATFLWLALGLFHQTRINAQIKTDFWSFVKLGSAGLLPVTTALIWFFGVPFAGFALLLYLGPVVHFALPLNPSKPIAPDYGRAVARMKFGRFNEAEKEVLRELEEHQDDFNGWMMLAELYANQFRDLPAAEQTICDLLNQPNVTVAHAAIALHRLADWQLKIGEDPEAARLSLEEICRRAPGSHLETIARHRIEQLPKSRRDLIASRQSRPIPLPPSADAQKTSPAPPEVPMSREMADGHAQDCLARLEKHPQDTAARERLARLWASPLGDLPKAVAQIEHLLALPDQPDEKRAHWLALMAGWHMDLTRDLDSAKNVLARLIEAHPRSPHTFETQRQVLILQAYQRLSKARLKPGPKGEF